MPASSSTSELTIEDQRQLIESLRAGKPFPESCAAVEVIETHISWVLLCGHYAYKIKKAVNLGFLDFSTLAKRKHYCSEELRLNRRLAPNLYLQAIAIGGSLARPSFRDDGNPIEYAVKMARFEQADLLDRRLREGRLSAQHIDRLSEIVADFHARQSSDPPDPELGTPHAVHEPVRANFAALRDTVTAPALLGEVDKVQQWAEEAFMDLRPVFDDRRHDGFVRECHGDMHLGNMAVHDQELIVFDGIEFNPSLYWIDVMSEAAFLFMDLDDHGRSDFAWRFLNGYLARTGDYGGVRVLRYYLCYRAMVRAKVAAIRHAQTDDRKSQRALADYLSLALRYSRPRPAFLAIAHGVSGSGKSTVCEPLSERIGALHIRSDRERQRLFGRGAGAGVDGGSYGPDATERTYGRLRQAAADALAAGFPVIVDATFLDASQRTQFAALAAGCGAPLRILHFRAEPERLRERVRSRHEQARDISEADLAVLEHQLRRYEPLSDAEKSVTLIADTERATPALVEHLAGALEALARNGCAGR